MPGITVHRACFTSREAALEELQDSELHVLEMTVPPVRNESHWHDFSTQIYMLDGELRITDTARDLTLTARPGDRVDVPARVLHSEDSAGYQIIAAMSSLPGDPGHVNLPPEALGKT